MDTLTAQARDGSSDSVGTSMTVGLSALSAASNSEAKDWKPFH